MTSQKLDVMLLSLAQNQKGELGAQTYSFNKKLSYRSDLSFHSLNLRFNFDNSALCIFSSTLFQLSFTLLIILIEILLSKKVF